MALTADRRRYLHEDTLLQRRMPVAAGAQVFLGALVMQDANGFLVPNADVAGGKGIYLALEAADNTAGSNGEIQVLALVAGVGLLEPGPLVQADVGSLVHATDDETLALTSANARVVGRLVALDNGLASVTLG